MKQKRHFKGNNKTVDKARRKENAEKWANSRGDSANRTGYDTPTVNERLEAFYKAQHFVSEEEWDAFMTALRSPLPACFRINPNYVFADELTKQLHDFVGKTIVVDGVDIEPVEQISWYPNGYGYKLGTDRRNIRKMEALEGLHKWMIQHTDSGNITRQEAVSMVPPLALDVSPHHKCLDMCAAPGSKTSQLLEVVDRSVHKTGVEQGLVVANDSDTDRAYMLVHQCKRMNSPLLVVTTHKGQLFPTITPTVDEDTIGGAVVDGVTPSAVHAPVNKDGYFDRVLCDVPCSGDGTLRKNPGIWSKWTTASGLTIHPLQLLIAQRGVQELKTGGLMVYSTCSLSPYENEAVVAELLRTSQGTLELVDAREFVPLFKARPGLSSWHVMDDYLAIKQATKKRKTAAQAEKRRVKEEAAAAATAIYGGGGGVATVAKEEVDVAMAVAEGAAGDIVTEEATVVTPTVTASSAVSVEKVKDEDDDVDVEEEEEAAAGVVTHSDPLVQECLSLGMQLFEAYADVPEHLNRKIRPSVFSPSAEEREWMHLERCLRCVPHDEDTGGFFVATLRKIPASDGGRAARKAATAAAMRAAELVAAAAAGSDGGEGMNVADDAEAAAIEAEAAAAVETEDSAAQAAGGEGDEEESGEQGSKRTKLSEDQDTSSGKRDFASQRGLVDFKQWDVEQFNKVKEFYGFADTLPASAFFVREDFCTNKASGISSKSIYYIPSSVRDLFRGDRDARLKIVCAGIKVLEKKQKPDGTVEYRLVQEGIPALIPHITRRTVDINIQDFSNLLGGGMVSFNTLSADTVTAMASFTPGAVIAVYTYSPSDVIGATEAAAAVNATVEAGNATVVTPVHKLFAICWRGSTRTLNVMCGKVEIDGMKHQLTALNVLRPKIAVVKRDQVAAAVLAVSAATAVIADATTAVVDAVTDAVASTIEVVADAIGVVATDAVAVEIKETSEPASEMNV